MIQLRTSCRIKKAARVLLACSVMFSSVVAVCGEFQRGAQNAANPVIPGDHPDPSIIRVGRMYWMASTSGDWSPQFTLYHSTDLHHWQPAGAIFPTQPAWAVGSFWAPELVYDGGRVLVYYVGRKRDGPLCVGVATAPRPEGPYTDHEPLVCQPDGSIDPAFARDARGAPYLIWKEDGNSQHKPTPLWAQPLDKDLIRLMGEKTQLLVNEPESWEGDVVEAPYILRHGGLFYLFYAGNACCGTLCHYAEGVARAPNLLGPWVKNPANPIIRPNANWRCPGHGSAVHTSGGKDFFLYHAYPEKGSIYLGRESLLDRITWRRDGWPEINGGRGPGGPSGTPAPLRISDDFSGPNLSAQWGWPANHLPLTAVYEGKLTLTVSQAGGEFIARSPDASDYQAQVEIEAGTGLASLVIIGNAQHAIGLGRRGDTLELWRTGSGDREVLWHGPVEDTGLHLLRVQSNAGGTMLTFFSSLDGKSWKPAGAAVDVTQLPQWDQGLRVGLEVDGASGETAIFRHFSLLAK